MFSKYFKFNKEKFSNSTDFLALKGNLAINGNLNASNISLEQTSSINFGNHKLSIDKDGQLTINGKKVSFMGVPKTTSQKVIITPGTPVNIAKSLATRKVSLQQDVMGTPITPKDINSKSIDYQIRHYIEKTLKINEQNIKKIININISENTMNVANEMIQQFVTKNKATSVAENILKDVIIIGTKGSNIDITQKSNAMLEMAAIVNIVNNNEQKNELANKVANAVQTKIKNDYILNKKSLELELVYTKSKIIIDKIINNIKNKIKQLNLNNNSNLGDIIVNYFNLEMDKHIATTKISNKFLLQRIKNTLISIFNSINENTCLNSAKARNMAEKLKLLGNKNVRVLQVAKTDSIVKCISQLLKNRNILRPAVAPLNATAIRQPTPIRVLSNTFNLEQVKQFNIKARKLPLPFFVEFTSNQEAPYDKVIYKRLTPIGDWNFYRLLHYDWFSNKQIEGRQINNKMNVDFKLYKNVNNAINNIDAWTFCNFDDAGVGFGRDCGPTGPVGGKWVSYYPGQLSRKKTEFNFKLLNKIVETPKIKKATSPVKQTTPVTTKVPYTYMGRKAVHEGNSDQGFAGQKISFEEASRKCDIDTNCGGIMKNTKSNTFWGKKKSVVDKYMKRGKWDTENGDWEFWTKTSNINESFENTENFTNTSSVGMYSISGQYIKF